MKEQDQTEEQLINELQRLRQRVAELEEAEAKLRGTAKTSGECEERYRRLVEQANDNIFLTDSNGLFTHVNEVGLRLTGYSEDEIIGTHFLQLIHPEHRKQAERFYGLQLVKKIPNTYYEYPVLTKHGDVVWFGQNVQLLMEGNAVVGFQAIARDITERKRSEEEREQALSLLRATLESTADGILVVDAEGKIASYNREFVTMWHIPEDVIESRSDDKALKFVLDQLSHPEDFLRKVRDLYGQPDAESFDVLEFTDGRIFERYSRPQRIGENIVGRVWSFRDVSKRRQAEEELQKQYELQRALFSAIPAHVYFKDKDSVYIAANKALCQLSRVPENEVQGKTDYDFFSETDADSFRRDDAEIIASGKAKLNYEMKGTDAEGNTVWFSTSKAPFHGTSGEISGLVGICIDITELRRSQELLLQSERFRAVADLAGGVAHNFNNLLQIVIGNLELAIMDLESGNYPDVKDALEKVLQSSKFGAETVRRLQSFAGIRDHSRLSEKGAFDLSGIVKQALEMSKTWWKTIPEKEGTVVSLDTELQDGCLVQCERNELFEVVVNLIKNATEALPQGGAIDVKTLVRGNQVVLKVRDTGIGMSEEDLTRLFNPFFTRKAGAGSGLGLASSRKIIEDCGGEILVESSEGKGTTFTVLLPLSEQPSEPTSPPAHVSGPRMTTLVIDDMKSVRDVLKAGLTIFNHVVLSASSGEQGLEIFKKNPIDLIICDLGMPGMNGWEVGKRVTSICEERRISKTPFILLTGWGGQKAEAEKIAESGVDAVVEKPVDITNMVEIIRQIMEGKPRRDSK